MKIENFEFKPVGIDGIYVCDRAVLKAPFDMDGCNDWEKSSGKKLLEQWFKEHAPMEIQEQFDIDLPTVEEVFSQKMLNWWGGDSVKGLVSKQFPIFQNSDNRMMEFVGEPIWWWTRSTYAGLASKVWLVNPEGSIHRTGVDATIGFVPVLRKKDPKERIEMKTLIISNYDGGYGFSVYDNGKTYEIEDIKKDKNHKFLDLYRLVRGYKSINTYIKENYINDYDLIVVCENGDIEIVKEQEK